MWVTSLDKRPSKDSRDLSMSKQLYPVEVWACPLQNSLLTAHRLVLSFLWYLKYIPLLPTPHSFHPQQAGLGSLPRGVTCISFLKGLDHFSSFLDWLVVVSYSPKSYGFGSTKREPKGSPALWVHFPYLHWGNSWISLLVGWITHPSYPSPS